MLSQKRFLDPPCKNLQQFLHVRKCDLVKTNRGECSGLVTVSLERAAKAPAKYSLME